MSAATSPMREAARLLAATAEAQERDATALAALKAGAEVDGLAREYAAMAGERRASAVALLRLFADPDPATVGRLADDPGFREALVGEGRFCCCPGCAAAHAGMVRAVLLALGGLP